MVRNISTLAPGEIGKILRVPPRIISRWIDRGKLKGGRMPGSKYRRVSLTEIMGFMSKYNFPRTPLLKSIEGRGATKDELEHYGITEPIGRGNIRLYPNNYSILTNGEISELVNFAQRPNNGWKDKTELGYKLPCNGRDRRMTADNFLRAHLKYRKNMPIPDGLETKTSLLINYPGAWNESQRITNHHPNQSVWYRANGKLHESSIRSKNDGLYIKLENELYYFILLGMTERKEFGKVAHPSHLKRIFTYLQQGITSLNNVAKKNGVKQAKKFLEDSEGQLKAHPGLYYEDTGLIDVCLSTDRRQSIPYKKPTPHSNKDNSSIDVCLSTDKKGSISNKQPTIVPFGKGAGPIDDYCREISNFPLLTGQKEKELATRIQQGTGITKMMFTGELEIERKGPGFIIMNQPPTEISENIRDAISDMEQNMLIHKWYLNKHTISIKLLPGATIDTDVRRYLKTEKKTLRLSYRTIDATRAKEELLTANLALVISIAKGYGSKNLWDIIGYGNLGLIEAADNYDPDRNTRFSTHAAWWINQAIKYHWVKNEHFFRIQGRFYNTMMFIKKTEQELTTDSYYPTNAEIFDKIKIHQKNGHPDYVKKIRLKDVGILRPIYQAHAIPIDENVLALPDTSSKSQLDTVISDEIFHQLLPKLPKRSEKILGMYFGYMDTEPMGPTAIGRKIGLTKERVRQIKNKSIKYLQKALS